VSIANALVLTGLVTIFAAAVLVVTGLMRAAWWLFWVSLALVVAAIWVEVLA
jgi:hypothetical protein